LKIYTKTGDAGQTGLVGGQRIAKHHPRMDAIGDVDELNAAIGLCATGAEGAPFADLLINIQNWLFDLGAELATPSESRFDQQRIGPEASARLEQSIDEQNERLEPLRNFILPGGTDLAARLHLARSICRRAERSVLALHAEDSAVRDDARIFLNRLSDWLFVCARTANHLANVQDVKWSQSNS
jgi:cob(I)alamin adenosyltransferase